jgi:hypothetical protein
MKKLLIITLGATLLTPTLALSDLDRECRGVAAGVVSSMRANNELATEAMVKAATLAASRGCIAALQSFSSQDMANSESEDSNANQEDNKQYMEKMSVFEFLSQDQEGTAGHDRLKKRR